MKRLVALISIYLLCVAALAVTPAERLTDALAQAQVLAEKHAYAQAAAVLEKLAADREITVLESWPDTLYPRARYLALAGQSDKAMAMLRYAAEMGALPADMTTNGDLASLRDRPEFKALMAQLDREEALWKDNPALATPYKSSLTDDEKVAGLSKIWSEARFNFPFFGRIAEVDWDTQYMAYLPKVRAAKTTEEYYRVLARYMGTLRDGHTRIIAPPELNTRLYAVAPLSTRLVDGKVVVTEIEDPTITAKGVAAGTELVAINGRDVFEYARSDVEPYVFGFSPQDRTAWIYGIELLRGPLEAPLDLTFRRTDGTTFPLTVRRRANKGGYFPETPIPAEFKMLPGNIAYLRIQEFVDDAAIKMLRANFTAISRADGFVIDIRHNGGGRDENMHPILKILAQKPYDGQAWRSRKYIAAQRSWRWTPGWTRSAYKTEEPDAGMHYDGPVVVLTSGTTYSAAEQFTSTFQLMKRGTVIGGPTGGSLGNPFSFRLPGGGMGLICTKDDYFPDGRLFNGSGIMPDVLVAPTLADIRTGRDGALEKAMEVLKLQH